MSKRKRKLDQILDERPWDVEIGYLINQRGFDLDRARTLTVLRWMYWGDLRPLAAAIYETGNNDLPKITLEKALLNYLARMIVEGRLTAQPPSPNKPQQVGKFARDYTAWFLYDELIKDTTSVEAVRQVAKALGIGEQSVRNAITYWRKNAK
jgi:hypothetical protein